MEAIKKTGIERFNYFVERAALWAGFMFLQIMVFTVLCGLFVEHDTAVSIAWVTAMILTLISALNKTIRSNVVAGVLILFLIVGVVAFFDILGGVAHLYGIGSGR